MSGRSRLRLDDSPSRFSMVTHACADLRWRRSARPVIRLGVAFVSGPCCVDLRVSWEWAWEPRPILGCGAPAATAKRVNGRRVP